MSDTRYTSSRCKNCISSVWIIRGTSCVASGTTRTKSILPTADGNFISSTCSSRGDHRAFINIILMNIRTVHNVFQLRRRSIWIPLIRLFLNKFSCGQGLAISVNYCSPWIFRSGNSRSSQNASFLSSLILRGHVYSQNERFFASGLF